MYVNVIFKYQGDGGLFIFRFTVTFEFLDNSKKKNSRRKIFKILQLSQSSYILNHEGAVVEKFPFHCFRLKKKKKTHTLCLEKWLSSRWFFFGFFFFLLKFDMYILSLIKQEGQNLLYMCIKKKEKKQILVIF